MARKDAKTHGIPEVMHDSGIDAVKKSEFPRQDAKEQRKAIREVRRFNNQLFAA